MVVFYNLKKKLVFLLLITFVFLGHIIFAHVNTKNISVLADSSGSFSGFSGSQSLSCSSPQYNQGSLQLHLYQGIGGSATQFYADVQNMQVAVDYPLLQYLDFLEVDPTNNLQNNVPQLSTSIIAENGTKVDFGDYNNYVKYLQLSMTDKGKAQSFLNQFLGSDPNQLSDWQAKYDGSASLNISMVGVNKSSDGTRTITSQPLAVTIPVPGFKGALAKYFLEQQVTGISGQFTLQDLINVFNSNTPVNIFNSCSYGGKNKCGGSEIEVSTNSNIQAQCKSPNQAEKDDISVSSTVNIQLNFSCASDSNVNQCINDLLNNGLNAVQLNYNSMNISGLDSMLAQAWKSEQGLENYQGVPICHGDTGINVAVGASIPNSSYSSGLCILGFIDCNSSGNISTNSSFYFPWVGNMVDIANLNTQRFNVNGQAPTQGAYEQQCSGGNPDCMAAYLIQQGVLDPNSPDVKAALGSYANNPYGAVTSPVCETAQELGGGGTILPPPPPPPGGGGGPLPQDPSCQGLTATTQSFLLQLSKYSMVPAAVIAAEYNVEVTMQFPRDASLNLSDNSTNSTYNINENCSNSGFAQTSSSEVIPNNCASGPGQMEPESWLAIYKVPTILSEFENDLVASGQNRQTLDSAFANAYAPNTLSLWANGSPGYAANFNTTALGSAFFMRYKYNNNSWSGAHPSVWTQAATSNMAYNYGDGTSAYVNHVLECANVYEHVYGNYLNKSGYSYQP